MFARVALRANLDMCCAGPPLSARSRLTARPPVCLSRAPSGVTQRDEGATLLTYLLSYGCRVPEHSLRSNLKDLVKSAQFSAAKILTVCASAAQRASRAPPRLALALPPMTDDPHPADSLPSRAQALELIKSYDTTKHSVGGLKAFNKSWRELLTAPSVPPQSSSHDDGDDDDGAREVADELESALVSPEDEAAREAASEMRAEPEFEPESTTAPVDVLSAELGSLALGTEAGVHDLAVLVFDLFAEGSAAQMVGVFVREMQTLAAGLAEQERPRRQIVPHRRLSATTLAALPGMRAAAARAATPADAHASEVAALTALLAAAREELAAAKAGLAQAAERQFERKRPLAEVTDGGNAPH